MRPTRQQFIVPTMILVAVPILILAACGSDAWKVPPHPNGFPIYVPDPCQPIGPGVAPPPDDREPQVYIRIRGPGDYTYGAGGELYYAWHLRGQETPVASEELDKLLARIFIPRPQHELFIVFEGGTYTDLIRVVDAFFALPSPPSSPSLFDVPQPPPVITLLTRKLEQEEISNAGTCIYHNDPPPPIPHAPGPPRPVPRQLRSIE